MPPVPLPGDPLWQWALSLAVFLLGWFARHKGINLPLLPSPTPAPAPAPNPSGPPLTLAEKLAALIPNLPDSQIDDLIRSLLLSRVQPRPVPTPAPQPNPPA